MQISKALQSRSEAIKTALKTFNATAGVLGRPSLDLSTVLDYVFLGQFDLLRGSRHDVLNKPWSRQVERAAMTSYFKLVRSREEVRRVEVEMRRLGEFIVQERRRVSEVIDELEVSDPLLASHLIKREKIRQEIDELHQQRLESAMKYIGETQVIAEFVDEVDEEESDEESEDIATALDVALNAL